MQLLTAYEQSCSKNGYLPDPAQIEVVRRLERFADAPRTNRRAKGLYLWGNVGRGKTMLMDLFYEQFPGPRKRRIHFHALMREVRDRLAAETGPNPMRRVVSALAPENSLLCIDEMHITDVDNALIVELLLTELLKTHLVVVTTSNFSPDDLMPDAVGISRASIEDSGKPGQLFLASRNETLRMIDDSFELVRIEGERDYRSRSATRDGRYIAASNADREFEQIVRAGDFGDRCPNVIEISGRTIPCVERYERAIWWNYDVVCEGAFSYRDYLEVLGEVDLLLLGNVNVRSLDGARRFAWLVEVIYDLGKSLVVSSSLPRDAVFSNLEVPDHMMLEFARVASRLEELTG
ncbi:MAG: cell division protein ZapE [Pseudomonadales bacterium]|nr:cell division protein ZapE [Pseudomonadales bacterium]